MVTAESITDEQIRELRAELVRDGFLFDAGRNERARLYLYDDALYAPGDARIAARARCAEILNARAKESR